MKIPDSYLANCFIVAVAAGYAWRLSEAGRGPVDWIVLGLLGYALAWNLVRLGRRLHAAGGPGWSWRLVRTLGFWILGLSGLFRALEDGSSMLRLALAAAMLLLAAWDSLQLARLERLARPSTKPAPRADDA